MQQCPIVDAASQTLSITLGGQVCRITLRTFTTGLFCDLYVNDALVVGGSICEDRNLIVRNSYLGFDGDLMFIDTQGTSDPVSPGLGTRFSLVYISPDDMAALGFSQ